MSMLIVDDCFRGFERGEEPEGTKVSLHGRYLLANSLAIVLRV